MNPDLRYFSEEQANVLQEWRRKAKRIAEWKEWHEKHTNAWKEIQIFFRKAHFFEGRYLNKNRIDELFDYSQWGQGGRRGLNRNLYEANGVKNFNNALRKLLDENIPLPERFANFSRLQGAGVWVTSQLLCKKYPKIRPFVGTTANRTGFMDKVIFNNLTLEQIKLAEKDATRKFGKISDGKTLRYLTYYTLLYRDILQLS